ncbi:hypothetical protein LCGC14_0776680 [marine sediment metagenome]|uniref:Portal protein n=1 Tax=marine sediment metagenome TaxID=412755 RepID=A0A0F9Q0X9_9ZZZZ
MESTTSVVTQQEDEKGREPSTYEGDIGLRGDKLDPELQNSLREIVVQFEQEEYTNWRYQYAKFAYADFFYKGSQNLYWDYGRDSWREPTGSDYKRAGYDEGEIYHYPVNFYEALSESIMAVLGQRRTPVRFIPKDFQKETDIAAAKAANDAKPYIDRINKWKLLQKQVLYNAFNHGIWGGYTRWLVDKDRFGTHPEPDIEMKVATLPAHFLCPGCGERTPADSFVAMTNTCLQCGGEIGEEHFNPERQVEIPQVKEVREVANGQVITNIYDGLELKLPHYAKNLSECPFLGLATELHETSLRDAYPGQASKISGGPAEYGGEGSSIDRSFRLGRMESTSYFYSTTNAALVTWRRYWLRPSTFWKLEKAKREALEKYFPKGVRVEFVNDQYLAAYAESMDDHWALGRAKEGKGMFTPSIGQSALPLQQAYNFDEAIKREYIEYKSFEPEFVDANAIDFHALDRKKIRAREMIPVTLRGGRNIRDIILQKKTGRGPEAAFRHAPDIFNMARFLVGAPPTLTGGTDKSLKPMTYAADRDLALGRKGIHWDYITQFWQEVAKQQLVILRENLDEDIRYQNKKGSELEKVTVPAAMLKAGEFDIYAEVDDAFPMLIEQQREVYMNLIGLAQQGNERLQQVLSHPRNTELNISMIGMPQLYIPGEDDRSKQRQEIYQLLSSEPIQQGDDLIPSVLPEQHVDNHAIHSEELQNFLVSEDGLREKESNPMGYANCVLHKVIHDELGLAQLAQAQAVAAGPEAAQEEKPKPAEESAA